MKHSFLSLPGYLEKMILPRGDMTNTSIQKFLDVDNAKEVEIR